MTKYELPDGTTVMIPTELLLKLSDTELQDYLASASGFAISNPFFDSVLEDGEPILLVEQFELPAEVEDIPEGFIDTED